MMPLLPHELGFDTQNLPREILNRTLHHEITPQDYPG